MKKRITIICLLLCFLIPATAYAASTETVKATLTKLKMYFNGSQVKGNVLTYNKVNYVPVSLLTDNLGFSVTSNTKTNRLTITEEISKTDLQNQIDELNNENYELQSEITNLNGQISELNEKLRYYSGGAEDYTGETDDDYLNDVNNATSMGAAVYPKVKNQFIKTNRNSENATWYKVDLYEGEGLTIAMRPQIDKGYMYIALYDASGSALSSNYSAMNGKYAKIGYKASTATTVYVKVTGEKGIYYIGYYDWYDNNENSLNDNRDFFGSLHTARVPLSQTYTYYRSDENLEDWYRVSLLEGETLSVSCTAEIDKGYLYMSLYNIDGDQLSSNYSIMNGKTATMNKTASTDTTYFIKITGVTGKYTLTIIE